MFLDFGGLLFLCNGGFFGNGLLFVWCLIVVKVRICTRLIDDLPGRRHIDRGVNSRATLDCGEVQFGKNQADYTLEEWGKSEHFNSGYQS